MDTSPVYGEKPTIFLSVFTALMYVFNKHVAETSMNPVATCVPVYGKQKYIVENYFFDAQSWIRSGKTTRQKAKIATCVMWKRN